MNICSTIDTKKQPKTKVDKLLSGFPFDKWFNNPNVSVLRLSGVISSKANMRNAISFESMNPLIEKAFSYSRLAAVCLLINSPGGSPVQSELIAKRIRSLAVEKDVPVFAFIEDVGASGGYWLACAADEIYASYSSIVGSIGVISAGFGFQDAIAKMGIERRVHISGKNKSVLDPFKPEKSEDVQLIKNLQEQIHNHFIDYVKSRRRAKLNQTDEILFTGEFWTGKIASDFGLIDGINDLYHFLDEKFGKDVNVNFIKQKTSWIKNNFGLNKSSIVSDISDVLESKTWLSKFGL